MVGSGEPGGTRLLLILLRETSLESDSGLTGTCDMKGDLTPGVVRHTHRGATGGDGRGRERERERGDKCDSSCVNLYMHPLKS